MGEQYSEILYDIRDRLVRMETKMEGMQGAKEKAYAADNRSLKNEEDIEEIKDDNKWLWRTVVVLSAGFILEFIGMVAFYLMTKGGI
jgi:hypothetical protein